MKISTLRNMLNNVSNRYDDYDVVVRLIENMDEKTWNGYHIIIEGDIGIDTESKQAFLTDKTSHELIKKYKN